MVKVNPTWQFDNPLLQPVFERLAAVIDYTHVSVYTIDGADLNLLAYHGPIPAQEAAFFSFPLVQAGGARFVIEQNESLVITDAKGDTDIARAFRNAMNSVPYDTFNYIGSWIGLPLSRDGKVIGMLDLAHHQRDYYTHHHVDQASQILNQMSENIENSIHFADIQRRAQETETLFSIQQAITSQLDSKIVLQLIGDEALRLTSAQCTMIFLLQGAVFSRAITSGVRQGLCADENEIPATGTILGEVLATNKVFRINDVSDDPRFQADKTILSSTRSLLAVPLRAQTNPVGVMIALNKSHGSFSPYDERVLTMLASSAVIGIDNARLYRGEQERRRVAEAMQAIQDVLNSSQPLPAVLETTVQLMGHMFRATAGAIYLQSSENQEFRLVAGFQLPQARIPTKHLNLPPSNRLRTWAAGPSASGTVYSAILAARDSDEPDSLEDATLLEKVIAHQVAAGITMPLTIKSDLSGAVELYFDSVRPYYKHELVSIESIGHRIAATIESDRLSSQLSEMTRIQERQRIAQTLHDTVAQMLFRIGLEAEWCLRYAILDAETGKKIQTIRRLVTRSSHDLRSAIFALDTSSFGGKHNLVNLLQAQVTEFEAQTPIRVNFIFDAELPELSSEINEAIFRIVRESLFNAHKHSQATIIMVSLHADPQNVTITIQDNGVGIKSPVSIDSVEADLHFGVSTMNRLTTQLGGTFLISNSDDQGAMVKACFPLKGNSSL